MEEIFDSHISKTALHKDANTKKYLRLDKINPRFLEESKKKNILKNAGGGRVFFEHKYHN